MELEYILFIVAAIVALAGLSLNKKRKSARNLRRKIENSWGTKPSGKYKEEDMQAIAGYYENLHEAEGSRILLDDITWNDLDMDNVYKRLNSTFSTVGEEYLYALLREPVTDPGILKERGRLADFFRSNPEQRVKLQYIFASLGKKRFAGVSNHFFSKAEYNPFQRNKYILQLAIFLLSPFVMIVNLPVGVLLLISSFILNMTTYYKAKNLLSEHLDSMSYMVNLITYSMKIANCNIPGLERYSAILRKSASKFKSTGFKSFYQIFYNTQDPFLEYIKIIFLVELISFESINKKISLYRTELRELFETVGLLDSMAAVASFQESVPFYTIPVMYQADAAHKPSLQFKDIYHPLIDEPVTNSVSIKKPVLITGSNASGKSTFLKTAAINAILAQTISTCLASEYSSCYFLIYTSMALRDDLQGSESYYIAEIKSLKRILDRLNDRTPLLCVIDEVLRGTNTIERIAASSQVMRYIAGKNCICMTATHDVELVSILDGLFDNYHFQESFKDNNILFDYRIVPGKSNTRNAIKLLEIMGYPESTVRAARESAERFERKGSWGTAAEQAS